MARLAGKVAMVVGAGSVGPGWGNGKATAVAFAREGARVFCVDRDLAAAQETAGLIAGEGGEAIASAADVARPDDIVAAIADCLSAFGRIDVLDNNVGIFEAGDVTAVEPDTWDRVFAINLKSAYLAMREVIPVMVRQGSGSIINLSSVSGIRHLGISDVTYGTSKAAMNHMTRITAAKFARDKVRVNAIVPGLLRTPFVEASAAQLASEAERNRFWASRDARVPIGHMGDAWDVAHAAVFLASEESRYVTGIELVVDGGLTC